MVSANFQGMALKRWILDLMDLVLNKRASEKESFNRCQTEGSAGISSFPPTTLASIAGAIRERMDGVNLELIDCSGSLRGWDGALAKAISFKPYYLVLKLYSPYENQKLRTSHKTLWSVF